MNDEISIHEGRIEPDRTELVRIGENGGVALWADAEIVEEEAHKLFSDPEFLRQLHAAVRQARSA